MNKHCINYITFTNSTLVFSLPFSIMKFNFIVLSLLLFSPSVLCVWITDYYPQEYEVGVTIPIKANSMVSEAHPNEPLDYYSLAFCEAHKSKIKAARRAENLGEILIGDKVLPTMYNVDMKVDRKKVTACVMNYNKKDIELFKELISKKYKVRWLMDSLPNLQPLDLEDKEGNHKVVLYEQGFDLGYLPENSSTASSEVYVYSHVYVEINFHDSRIVGFHTLPSVPILLQATNSSNNNTIEWTYSVKWKETTQPWGSRWDVYGLNNTEGKSVYIISTLTSLFFIFIVSMYLKRRLGNRILRNLGMDKTHMSIEQLSDDVFYVSVENRSSGCKEGRDVGDYDNIDFERDTVACWTLLRNEIYHPPRMPELMCALVGSGVQILTILLTTALLAMLGILYAAHRGLLINCIMITFFLTSGVNSFVSAWLYNSMVLKRRDDIANFLTSFFIFPVLLLLIIFPVNIILQHRHAASSIYWSTLGIIIFGWLSISLFTSSAGYYLGKTRKVTHLRVSNFPRPIPVSKTTQGCRPHLARIAIGVASFSILWMPLKFIYMSVWGTMFYQLYALQWISMLLWLFFTTELCIAYIFWQLNAENYHWWWSSYFTGISVALPTLMYSIIYYAMNSDITSFASVVIYFGYALVFSLVIMLLSGSVCFLASFFFIKRTYVLHKVA